MGVYSRYLDSLKDFPQITEERKKLLNRISKLRNNNDVVAYMSKLGESDIGWDDKISFYDQLSNLRGSEAIDIILETPGGLAEVVEDIVSTLHRKYKQVNVIVPGIAMSAGTIWAMGANEILMGDMSSLGPIDPQMNIKGKLLAAEAFLAGLDKIKEDCLKTGRLNPAYIPILQQISPGEIQACVNAQNLSQKLVKDWLAEYKFCNWVKHSSTGKEVTKEEKEKKLKILQKNFVIIRNGFLIVEI